MLYEVITEYRYRKMSKMKRDYVVDRIKNAKVKHPGQLYKVEIPNDDVIVITSYSIHYTKLYEQAVRQRSRWIRQWSLTSTCRA